MSLIQAPYLKKGDKIGIVACARKVSREEMEPAIEILKSWGLQVELTKNLFNADHQFSGTDGERAKDLHGVRNAGLLGGGARADTQEHRGQTGRQEGGVTHDRETLRQFG